MSQQQFVFFKDEPPSAETRKWILDPSNPESAYNGFVGNKRAVDKLIRIDFQALGRYNHDCSDLSIALIGGAGTGKTELAHRHCKANGLPIVEISPKTIKMVHDIFLEINKVCEDNDIPLLELDVKPDYYDNETEQRIYEKAHYVIPPINVFIDEVHALSPYLVQGLLKATEHKDRTLATEKGVVANCKFVHWIIATTDRGKLFDAFDTRFSKVILNLYTKGEIAEIVQNVNPELPMNVCQMVAHFCPRVPREALAFARELKMEYEMNSNESWVKAATKVADDNEIDELGMSYKRLAILKALGQGPVSEKRLPIICGCKAEELEKFILPWLMENTPDQDAMVTVSTRGYCITPAGLKELDVRHIPNNGQEAAA